MKKITVLILFTLFMFSAVVNAQKSNLIKTSLTSPFLKTYVIAYERVVNENVGAQLGFYYTGASTLDVQFSGFAITPEFRYYLSEEKAAPNGAFIAPFFRYQSFTLEDQENIASANFTGIGGGLLIGIQRVFKETISLSAFIGPSYISPSVEYNDPGNEFFDKGSGGFWARAGVNIGIAF